MNLRISQIGFGLLLSVAVNAIETPNPPKANKQFSTEQSCVEPIEIIRRYHGNFLKHHRNDTMHRGVRATQHSLIECINCHVTADDDGNYPNIKEGSEHFCRSCHNYAAVKIDCFECHASKPEKK
jgi:hypothetical protein